MTALKQIKMDGSQEPEFEQGITTVFVCHNYWGWVGEHSDLLWRSCRKCWTCSYNNKHIFFLFFLIKAFMETRQHIISKLCLMPFFFSWFITSLNVFFLSTMDKWSFFSGRSLRQTKISYWLSNDLFRINISCAFFLNYSLDNK